MDQERLDELKACYEEASSSSKRRVERLKDEYFEANAHDRVMDAVGDLLNENDNLKELVESQQQDIDDLNEQLEQQDAEMVNMRLQHQAEIDALQKQLLEAQNDHLESEKQQLESEKQQLVAEVKAKPMEIHNHFGAGSTSQVFNDKVSGKFIKDKQDKKDKKDKKKEKKRWKKIVRKVL